MTAESGFITTGQALYDPNTPGLSLLLVQILIIMFTCRLISIPFAYIHQPKVIAEIVGGILLGPTLMGRWSWFSTTIFPINNLAPLQMMAQIGLTLFLFVMGMELDMASVRARYKKSLAISLTGILCPFAISIGVSYYFYDNLMKDVNPKFSFSIFLLFIGIAMSITALPVLARILLEKKLLATPLGVMTIASAAVDDGISWTFLALVTALAKASSPIVALYIFLSALGFGLIMLLVVSPFLSILLKRLKSPNSRVTEHGYSSIPRSMVVISFIIMMISAFFTSAIGVEYIFGAFIAGLAMPREDGFTIALTERLEDILTLVLLPTYFTLSGLRTNISAIRSVTAGVGFFVATGGAIAGKLGGCTFAARVTGSSWRESFAIGTLMNAKGLVEIIVLNIGLSNKIISEEIFVVMVLMAITVTVMTTPLLAFILPSKSPELEEKSLEKNVKETLDLDKPFEKELNLVIAIPDIYAISGITNLVQYFNHQDANNSKIGPVKIHAARFMQVNERLSTLFLASNETETIQRDPALCIFKSFGKFRRITIVPHICMTSSQEFAKDLSHLAYENMSDMVILPFYQKGQSLSLRPSTVSMPGPASASDKTHGIASWFNVPDKTDHVPSSSSLSNSEDIKSHVADIADQLLRKCKTKVGILVQREKPNQIPYEDSGSQILVPFFGGPDDRESLLFALRLGAQKAASIHVLHVWASDGSSQIKDLDDLDLHDQDKDLIKYVKKSLSSPDPDCLFKLKYTFVESLNPSATVMEELKRQTYSFVILGFFGPHWNLIMQEEESINKDSDENTQTETNSNTVWSLFKHQATQSSIGSDKDLLVMSSSKTSKYVKTMGPLGALIYTEDIAETNMLIIRKLRMNLH